jgi:predicted metalloprotease with PDZ domain
LWGLAAGGPRSSAAQLPEQELAGLAAEDFRTREQAQAGLLAWSRERPAQAMDLLYLESRRAPDPEVRERCLAVLRELVIDDYLKEGEGYIGIRMQDETANVPGDPKPRRVIRVIQVVENSAASQAGLRINDLVCGLQEKIWHDAAASQPFSETIRQFKPGSRVVLKVLREGKLLEVPVKLGRRPLFADNPFLDPRQLDMEAAERAAKEAHFQRWLERRKMRE